MKISFEAPDEWEKLLDEQAKKDGHSNRAAVIRKIVNLFFTDASHFVAFMENKKEKTQQVQTTKN